MTTTATRYAFEQPGLFARGWHIVCFSQELAIGQVKRLHYFAQELVLFRGEDGQAAVLDAYCPHLGAHLAGTGSRVEANSVRCPFHGWQFNKDGHCTGIPYAKSIPAKAHTVLKSWPVCEHSGFIAIWHDPEGGLPNWELPKISDWNQGEFGDWRFNRKVIKSHGREIIENIVDVGHFPSVHGGRALQFDNRFTPYSVTQESRVQQRADCDLIQPTFMDFDLRAMRDEMGASEADQWGEATYHGPSVMYYYTTNKTPVLNYHSWWVNYHVPLNDTEVELTSGVIVASLDGTPLPQDFYANYPISAIAAFGQDVEVWETKRYRNDPVLCDGDGPITKLRKWYNRFYLPRKQEAWDEPEHTISSVRD